MKQILLAMNFCSGMNGSEFFVNVFFFFFFEGKTHVGKILMLVVDIFMYFNSVARKCFCFLTVFQPWKQEY